MPSKSHLLNGSPSGKRKRDVQEPKLTPAPLANGINGASHKNRKTTPQEPEHKKQRRHGPKFTEERKQLLRSRANLPIWPHATSIRLALLGDRHVMILAGETGSGKSTQVPQFLMSESWCKGAIAVTQPRRVAAISLARRVADEIGTPLGKDTPSSRVGYSVRFDQNFSPSTRIKYLTEGMLLQELLRDKDLKQYSVVVVDEVHERSVNVDLILGFLRRIVTRQMKSSQKSEEWRKGAGPLKVVIMSATADTEKLFRFFAKGFESNQSKPPSNSNSSTHGAESAPVNGDLGNDIVWSDSTWSGFSSSDSAESGSSPHRDVAGDFSKHISTIYIEGRQHPVETFHVPEPAADYLEAALKTIFQIHYKEPLPGDILVFLTGQDTVESLETLVNEHAQGMGTDVPELLVLPLFAGLSRGAQQRVFVPTPRNTRKVILATNIAETSLTIPGVSHVIDSGLHKTRESRPQLFLDTLLVKPISKSSAIQRKGRAGRQGPGKCYRLYTEASFMALDATETPEILRCDLANPLLVMKSRGITNLDDFPFLDAPSEKAKRDALYILHALEATDDSDAITQMGKTMARLPLSPYLARALMNAAKPHNDCVLEVIDIVSCLTTENIFLQFTSEEGREEAAEARRELVRREGDHLTLMAAVQAYAAENTDRRAWCEKYFVDHRKMKQVMQVRKQLRQLCLSLKLVKEDMVDGTDEPAKQVDCNVVLQSLIESTNLAMLHSDGSYKTVVDQQLVAVHPSSVLFGRQRKPVIIMFSELIFTSRCWMRCVSEVDLS